MVEHEFKYESNTELAQTREGKRFWSERFGDYRLYSFIKTMEKFFVLSRVKSVSERINLFWPKIVDLSLMKSELATFLTFNSKIRKDFSSW